MALEEKKLISGNYSNPKGDVVLNFTLNNNREVRDFLELMKRATEDLTKQLKASKKK